MKTKRINRIRYKVSKEKIIKAVTCDKIPALSFNDSGSISLYDDSIDNTDYWKYLDYVTQNLQYNDIIKITEF